LPIPRVDHRKPPEPNTLHVVARQNGLDLVDHLCLRDNNGTLSVRGHQDQPAMGILDEFVG
jgi:hypothetical protein